VGRAFVCLFFPPHSALCIGVLIASYNIIIFIKNVVVKILFEKKKEEVD
jgi:hypothetical protein